MKSDPIPTPSWRRWQEFRCRWLPVLAFVAGTVLVGMLWQKNLAMPVLVGQAEPEVAKVTSFQSGVLAELSVKRFQQVERGDVLGKVLVGAGAMETGGAREARESAADPQTPPSSPRDGVILRAPMSGVVSAIHNHPGEAVVAGQPIISLAALAPSRIVGYLRAPNLEAAKVGTKVRIRSRDLKRASGEAAVLQVGTQLEVVPPTLASPTRASTPELGLPVDIGLPPNLAIRPGELVDVILLTN